MDNQFALWLSNPEYNTGVELYSVNGKNKTLLALFKAGKNAYTTVKLREEITELSKAFASRHKEVPDAPEVKKFSKTLREPFNRVGAPAVLLELEIKKAKLFKEMAVYHSQLMHVNAEQRLLFAARILDNEAQINNIWSYLDYYTDKKTLHPDLVSTNDYFAALSPLALIKERNNIRSRISKHKDNEKRTSDVLQWRTQLEQIEIKLNSNAL